ncbi:SAF domain-containing protein [Saccharopolyspora sp. WRP15-2]|uniref:SAF domain-containing protein n=1 Tax=Saccharopolyspora oryzae TaxID=2997343 RepID=A0ABT4UWC1_9PSEU|nr:SAF domain-containing protein [Saccharopolyspora oryzae]MDA3626021.1 SAF domain-containing protein [Saccharopolyspora oryzae]
MASKDRLGASLRDRITALFRARRGVLLLRRTAALALLLLAAALAVQDHGPPGAGVPVLVAARDLPPGRVLSEVDVKHREIPVDLVPDGALRDSPAALGRVLGAAARRGELLTDARFNGPTAASGSGMASAPIRLADPEVADFLTPGRRVDIVTAAAHPGEGSVLAENAQVIAVQADSDDRDQGRLVFVGLPERLAGNVAAASLDQTVTVTLR